MGDLAPDPHLGVEPLEQVGGEGAAEELQGHGLAQLGVVGAVDLAEAASSRARATMR